MSLDLSFSSISSYINNVSIGQRGYCFLMDKDGNIIYHPQQQLLYSGLKSENTPALASLKDGDYADDTVIYCLTSIEDSDWRIVGVCYVDEMITTRVETMVGLLILILIIVITAALFTGLLISYIFARPARTCHRHAGL